MKRPSRQRAHTHALSSKHAQARASSTRKHACTRPRARTRTRPHAQDHATQRTRSHALVRSVHGHSRCMVSHSRVPQPGYNEVVVTPWFGAAFADVPIDAWFFFDDIDPSVSRANRDFMLALRRSYARDSGRDLPLFRIELDECHPAPFSCEHHVGRRPPPHTEVS
jgi:hypothetical protein